MTGNLENDKRVGRATFHHCGGAFRDRVRRGRLRSIADSVADDGRFGTLAAQGEAALPGNARHGAGAGSRVPFGRQTSFGVVFPDLLADKRVSE